MKILAIDLGDRRTGIAISDINHQIAGSAFTIDEPNRERLIDKIVATVAENSVQRVIIGNPINMNSTQGDRSQKSIEFAEKLSEKINMKIIPWDERRTTVTASHILSDAGKKRAKQRQKVDAVAASIILQSYLDYLAFHPDEV